MLCVPLIHDKYIVNNTTPYDKYIVNNTTPYDTPPITPYDTPISTPTNTPPLQSFLTCINISLKSYTCNFKLFNKHIISNDYNKNIESISKIYLKQYIKNSSSDHNIYKNYNDTYLLKYKKTRRNSI